MNLKNIEIDRNSIQADLDIRQAGISDYDSILRFLKKAYNQRSKYKFPERWNWEYVENYYWEKKNLPIWIAIHNKEIIGQTCAMYVPLKIGKKIYNAAWSVDTIVIPQFRGIGIGKRLQQASAKNHEIFMSLRSSAKNRKIKASFGTITLICVPLFRRWIKVNRLSFFDAVEERLTKSSFFSERWFKYYQSASINKVLVFLINAILILKNQMNRKLKIDPSIQISEVEHFSSSIDQYWNSIKSYFDFMVVRDQKYLNWRYVSQPHMNYRKFIATREKKICGYIVLRRTQKPESNVGIIAEIVSGPRDKETLKKLVKFAIDFFSSDVEAVKCATSVNEIKRILKEFGFSIEHKEPLMISSTLKSVIPYLEQIKSNCFFSMGDHDWDQYPLEKLKYQFSIFHLDAVPGVRNFFKSIFKVVFSN